MIRATATALVLAIAATPALAADLGGGGGWGGGPAAPVADNSGAQGFSWQGGYAGVTAGYGWGSADNANAGVGKWSNEYGNPLMGVYGGYNVAVTPNIIAGGEADLVYNPMKGSTVIGGQTRTNRTSLNGTVRARVGVAYDRILPYATAGIAIANQQVKDATGSSDQTRVGYALGAGVEGAITNSITARVEYMHQNYGNSNHALSGTTRADQSINQVRAGVGLKF
ncbi:MAG: porin family protein [Hyphomicrobiaceae bacterium]|nr:porin family protein [Hyphomicrobiaceae bacterium]